MNHGSLFSGIGGFDLAAEWMGWENIFHCEWNDFGQRVLKYYWPKAITYEDITKTDFTIHRGQIDILTGGFPCQPYSAAGKRKGKEDDRHLWPEMLRVVREIQPRWVVGENVLGLDNWNGGMVFDEVQADLEAEGYEVQAYVLPACAVNAPHRRDRVWFVAFNSKRNASRSSEYIRGKDTGRSKENEQKGVFQQKNNKCSGLGEISIDVANPERIGSSGEEHRKKKTGLNTKKIEGIGWQNFPTQSPIHNGDDGFSERLDSITFPKWRNESIKAGGNAIVPQVVYQIFKSIEKYWVNN